MMIKYYGDKKSIELKTESFLDNLSRYDISESDDLRINGHYSLEYVEWEKCVSQTNNEKVSIPNML